MEGSQQRNVFLILIASVAALGGFLFGYDTGVISGALVFISQTYPITTFTQELIVSAVVLGALLGSLFSGRLAHAYGSKQMLIYMAIMFIAGTLLSALAVNISMLIIGRFMIGIAIGITSYLSPLFISEMAPAHIRGALVLLNGIMITGGETIAFLIDYFLVPTQSWRLMFMTGIIPAILLLLGMTIMPASPRWMVLNGNIDKARKILCLSREKTAAEIELNEIRQQVKLEKSHWKDLFSKLMRPVLIIGAGLGMFQQFIGISTVMYYGPAIFKAAGFQNAGAQIFATFVMGLVNTLMTVVAVLIVDKVGRRRLLLSGIVVAGLSLSLISFIFHYDFHNVYIAWLTFIILIFYIAGYSLSLGSLFWLVIAEIYPLNIRSLGMSFAAAIQWAANLLVTLTFLSILDWMGMALTFWLYAFMCFISFLFCYYFVPETKGVSLEQIEQNLRQGKPSRELGQTLT